MKKNAFTLAEMMIVLLILSIILAVFAPIMTKRSTAGKSSEYWRSENGGARIYYGLAAGSRVNIGQKNIVGDTDSRLVINTGDDNQNHILFKRGGSNPLGFLRMDTNDNLRIGGMPFRAATSVFTGGHNTGIGISSLTSLSTGHSNTAVGNNSLRANTGGRGNTAVGASSLLTNTTGFSNTAMGAWSMRNNTTGNSNIAVGDSSLFANSTGSDNTVVGYYSLNSNSTGSNNTALGYNSCRNVTGSNKICIGASSGPESGSTMTTDAIERVFIGSASNLSGSPKIPDTSAVLEIHNHSRPKVVINGDLLVAGGIEFGGFCTIEQRYSGDMLSCDDRLGNSIDPGYFVNYSDLRLKNVKGENKSGLDKIKQLKVFNYTFKDDKKKTPRVGVIAQDLQKIFPDAVTKDEKGYLLIRMEDMFYALVNAVKELANRDAAKDAKIKELEKTLKQVQGDNTALEKRIQKLEAKLQ